MQQIRIINESSWCSCPARFRPRLKLKSQESHQALVLLSRMVLYRRQPLQCCELVARGQYVRATQVLPRSSPACSGSQSAPCAHSTCLIGSGSAIRPLHACVLAVTVMQTVRGSCPTSDFRSSHCKSQSVDYNVALRTCWDQLMTSHNSTRLCSGVRLQVCRHCLFS